jgi:hypothetical protein
MTGGRLSGKDNAQDRARDEVVRQDGGNTTTKAEPDKKK